MGALKVFLMLERTTSCPKVLGKDSKRYNTYLLNPRNHISNDRDIESVGKPGVAVDGRLLTGFDQGLFSVS